MMIYSDFLLALDSVKRKEIYAKIIALTFDEAPVEAIEGRITSGSINVDGDSAVRRTCSLTVAANNFDYSNYLWGLNTKFKLEIGVKNEIDKNYPDIIWFPQGVFVLTTFNVSRSLTNFTINLTGKDKMCLLNGELGGTFESSIDFGTIEEEDYNGNWIIRKIPIAEIIRNAVHTYGKEPYHNIIINDLDTYGIELLEYRYENVPLYLYRSGEKDAPLIYENALLENSQVELYTEKDNEASKITSLKDLPNSHLETLTTTLTNTNSEVQKTYTKVNGKFISWYFTKIEYGQTAGYRETELVYGGDLIAKVGENLTSILDRIKNMLSNFEYFYNLEGQFVFQKKQSFISTMWAPTDDESQIDLLTDEFVHYVFNNNELITAFNNNPNISNMKNDYSVWGERIGTSGVKIPVHIRYAIAQKPIQYKNIIVTQDEVAPYNSKYKLNIKPQTTQYVYKAAEQYKDLGLTIECDWREVIYQMAKDYYRYNWLDDFELRISQANPQYPTGRTGYERYYTDLEGFWRELYYPLLESDFSEVNDKYNNLDIYLRRLQIELYGTPIEWSENNLGGIENDLNGLSNLVANDYDKAKNLIKWWNGTGSKPADISSGYYLITYESKNKFNQDTRKKYIYENDTYKEITSFIDKNTDYFTTTFTAPKYNFKANNGSLIADPTLYLNLLQDLYYRKQSEYNTKQTEKDEVEVKKDKLKKDIESNYYMEQGTRQFWNKNVYEAPYLLNFWFDFLDTQGQLSNLNIQNVGIRSKAVQDSNIKSIYFRETPDIVFKDLSTEETFDDYIKSEISKDNYEAGLYYIIDEETYQYVLSEDDYNSNQIYYQKIVKPISGFKAIQVPSIEGMFTISAQGKSAKERLNELLYQHSCCMESATLSTIPIYHLQPNTRIKIFDEQSHLAGDYIINKISIPLAYNGTMSLTLTKAIEDIVV